MRFISREKWGARYGDGHGKRPLPATEAYLHHTVTIAPDIEWVDADGDGVDDDEERAMRTIEDIGRERFGWTYGLPYTACAMPRGHAVYEGHDVGQMGAHTYGHNDTAIGIALVGNYDKHRPPDAQLDAVAWALVEYKRRGWLAEARLTGGHRDVKATACPGRYAYAAIEEINRRAARLEQEDDVVTDRDVQRIAKATAEEVWSKTFVKVHGGKRISVLAALKWALELGRRAARRTKRLLTRQAEHDESMEPRMQNAVTEVASDQVDLGVTVKPKDNEKEQPS